MTRTEASHERDAIRRVLVVLHSSSPHVELTEASARLAGMLQTEITGLFVRDDTAVGGTAVSFTHEVRRLPASIAETTPGEIERHLQAQIRRIRKLLERRGREHGIRSRLEIVSGPELENIRTALQPGDLIALDEPGVSRKRSEEVAESLLRGGTNPLVVVRPEQHLPVPLVVVFEKNPAGERALAVAGQIARRFGLQSIALVALTGERFEPGEEDEYRKRMSERYSLNVTLHHLEAFDVVQLARVMREEGDGLVVMPGSLAERTVSPILGSIRALPWSFVLTP